MLLQSYSVQQNATPVLPSSTTLMIDPRHLWNFIYNVRNNRGASTKPPTAAPATENPFCTSPNTAPATKSIDPLHAWNVNYNARNITCHCPNSPNTAPATKSGPCTSPNSARATKSETCTSPSAVPVTKCDIWAIIFLPPVSFPNFHLKADTPVVWLLNFRY